MDDDAAEDQDTTQEADTISMTALTKNIEKRKSTFSIRINIMKMWIWSQF